MSVDINDVRRIAAGLGKFKEHEKDDGTQFDVCCPVHDDHNPSASLKLTHAGRLLFWCQKCNAPFRDAMEAIVAKGLIDKSKLKNTNSNERASDVKRTKYEIRDKHGKSIATKYRIDRLGRRKVFYYIPKLRDIARGMKVIHLPLYRIHEIKPGDTVVLTEGEKDADTLWSHGIKAVGILGGANAIPVKKILSDLEGCKIELWPDNDQDGYKCMVKIGIKLDALKIEHTTIIWPDAPAKGDATDFFEMGGTVESFEKLKRSNEPYNNIKPDESAVGQSFNLTDLGNAERFVAQYGNKIRYCHERKNWLIWDGIRWQWDNRSNIYRLAKNTIRNIYNEATLCDNDDQRKYIAKFAAKSESRSRIESMIALAQTERGISVLIDELDSDPFLLGVQNGVVDLRTRELRDARQDDLMTKCCTCEYKPDAQSDVWDKFLLESTKGDKELERYIQRVIGYSLLGRVREKHFWFIYGEPDGGKSTFIESVVAMMGDYATYADFNTWLVQSNVGGNRGDLVDLVGTRLVVSVEVWQGAKFDEALMKRVTGGDKLKCAAKYEKEIEFQPAFSLVLAANDAPKIRDDDVGMWSRMRRIPFTNKPERIDEELKDRLRKKEVQEAILAWSIAGHEMWRTEKTGTCRAVEESNKEYQQEMDRVEAFFDEYCMFGDALAIQVRALKEKYVEWADEHGVVPLNPKVFNKRLEKRNCIRSKVGGQKGWRGIALRENWACPNENETKEPNVIELPTQETLQYNSESGFEKY